MEQAGGTVKKKLLQELPVRPEQKVTQLHLKKKDHCSLMTSCAGNSGRVEPVILRYPAYYFLHDSVSNQQLKFDFHFLVN